MQTETPPPINVSLPARLAVVFRSLRNGEHICRDDLAEYHDLERNEELYRALFLGLGYELVHHGQGFYYFKGDNSLSSLRLQAISLFVLILFQDLEDKKFQESDGAWERRLLTRTFAVSELPHFQTPQRRSLMFRIGVTPDTLHEKVLRPLIRYGMVEMVGTDQFRFRSPVYRFVDVCMQFAEADLNAVATADGDEPVAEPVVSQTDSTPADNDEDEA
jgi:chromosome condensin MukBEF MukE localization factor